MVGLKFIPLNMGGVVAALLCISSCMGGGGSATGNDIVIDNALESENTLTIDGQFTISKLLIADSCLAVLTQQEPYFTLYRLDDLSKVSSFGRRGRSGGELITEPKGVNQIGNTFQYFDHAAKALISISTTNGHVQKIPMPYNARFRPTKAILINDATVVSGCFENGRLGYIDSNGNETICAEDYPFPTGDITGLQRGVKIQCELCAAPNLNRFVVRWFASDCFEIFEVVDNSVKRLFINNFKDAPVVHGDKLSLKESSAGYIRSYVDNQFIYLMKSEDKYPDVASRGHTSKYIDVYDWDGNQVGSISLYEEIGAFCVQGNYLYAVIERVNDSIIKKIDVTDGK